MTKEISPLQVFSGYENDCLSILDPFCIENAVIKPTYFIDGFGVRTDYSNVPFVDTQTLKIERLKYPIPDDGFHAEAIEYLSICNALDNAVSNNKFKMVELGAAWGPWVAMAGVICKKCNFEKIDLHAAEASPTLFQLLKKHLSCNQIQSDRIIKTNLFNGAVWTFNGKVEFPKSSKSDLGCAIMDEDSIRDYRNLELETFTVPCCTLQSLVGEVDELIDFIHFDIQGAEVDVILESINWLSETTKSLFIATHSRSVEGELIELLEFYGWKLLREKPCKVDWRKSELELSGRTIIDGGQNWTNLRFNGKVLSKK